MAKNHFNARYLNSMIDQSKSNCPKEPVDVALTRINGTIFTTAALNSAYNQIPLDNESMIYTHFTIGNEQYCCKNYSVLYQLDQQPLHQYQPISYIH